MPAGKRGEGIVVQAADSSLVKRSEVTPNLPLQGIWRKLKGRFLLVVRVLHDI